MGFLDFLFKKNKNKVENMVTQQDVVKTVVPKVVVPKAVILKQKEQDTEKSEKETIIERQKKITFRVAGISFNGVQGKLKNMVKEEKEENGSYEWLSNKEILEIYSDGDRIYEVHIARINEIELALEPENKFDSDAIKISLDKIGDIGHVPASKCKKIKKILEGRYYKEWKLLGGKCKHIEYDEEKDKDVVRVETGTYGIEITLTY